jgi:hypothetical protein
MSDVLTLAQAEDLATRTLAAIDEQERDAAALRGPLRSVTPHAMRRCAADRERVASDLEGLRRHVPLLMYFDVDPTGIPFCRACEVDDAWPCPDARRYSDNLRRTARLYGVEVPA